MIVVEITGAIDASGAARTFYLSNAAFTTAPTDTPPNVSFDSRLLDPGDIAVSIYRDGPTGGSASLEFGEIVFANVDGALDEWKNYGFDGRQVTVRVGDGGDYPADFVTVFAGSVASVVVGWDQVVVDLRDKAYVFSTPVLTLRYRGDNALPNGLEGTANDIGGAVKPLTLGRVRGVSPPCVNTAKLIFQVSSGPVHDIPAVYVKGAPQTRGADYATSALLQAATVSFGTYATCIAEGYFKLGGADGQVTCDVLAGNTVGDRTAAQMLRNLAQRAGLTPTEISLADIAALDLIAPAELGLYIDDERTYLDAMNEIAQSVGAWFAFDPLGVLRMGRLDAPSGDVLDTLQEFEIETPVERTVLQNEPTPIWSVAIQHTKVYTTQTSDLAGSVTPDQREFLKTEYRAASVSDATVQKKYKLAGVLQIPTLLTNALDAASEAQRMLSLHKVARDIFVVPISVRRFAELVAAGFWLGGEIGLEMHRFGLGTARAFVALGVSYQRKSQQIVLTLWGGDTPTNAAAGATNSIGAAVGRATGIGAAAGVGFGGTGALIAAGAGNAAGVGSASSLGSSGAGQAAGLLLAITVAGPTLPVTQGAGTAAGRGDALAAAASIQAGTGTAAGVGAATAASSTGIGLKDVVAINAHIVWQMAPYTNLTTVTTNLQSVGISYIRDHINTSNWQTTLTTLVQAGFKFSIIFDYDAVNLPISTFISRLVTIDNVAPGCIAYIEGANEIDGSSLNYGGFTGYAAWRQLSKDLWNAVKAQQAAGKLLKAKVLPPSLANSGANAAALGNAGELTNFADYNNMHYYYSPGQPTWGWDNSVTYATTDNALKNNVLLGKPTMLGESGAHNFVSSEFSYVDEQTAAIEIINTVFVHMKRNGMVPYFIYDCTDNLSQPAGDLQHYGIFHSDWTMKPIAKIIKTMLANIGDAFISTDFTFTISGLDTASTTGEKHFLMKRPNGTYVAVVWVEPDVWNESNKTDINVALQNGTITLPVSKTCSILDIYPGHNADAPTTTSKGTGTSFNFQIQDHPLFFLLS